MEYDDLMTPNATLDVVWLGVMASYDFVKDFKKLLKSLNNSYIVKMSVLRIFQIRKKFH